MMDYNEILNGNELIVKFMNFKTYEHYNQILFEESQNNLGITGIDISGMNISASKFHESWDWLMPVFKDLTSKMTILNNKIKSDKTCSWISKQGKLKHIDDCLCTIRCEIWGVRIEDAFYGITETIKWYNENVKIYL